MKQDLLLFWTITPEKDSYRLSNNIRNPFSSRVSYALSEDTSRKRISGVSVPDSGKVIRLPATS